MSDTGKSRTRRAEIRKNRPDAAWVDWEALRSSGVLTSVCIAAGVFLVAALVLLLRQYASPPNREVYTQKVNAYVDALQNQRVQAGGQQWKLIVLRRDQRNRDV